MSNRSRVLGADPSPPPPHMDEDDRRSGEDLISDLPDELLHEILVRLRCARGAGRTSVLSRRWRHVWAHLPKLHLDGLSPDTIDGALAGYLAPALGRLSISLPADLDYHALTERAAPWLRFAAERVAGKLRLCYVHPRLLKLVGPMEAPEVDLPACGRARTIKLFLGVTWRLRLRPAGVFSSLRAMTIHRCRMEGGELSNLVSTQCPRLSYLNLHVTLVDPSDIIVRSDSLRSLWFHVGNLEQLELVTPRLRKLVLSHSARSSHISAPKLSQLAWCGGAYDPLRHQLPDVGRHLRMLQISLILAPLMQRFDEVDSLRLKFSISQGIAAYQRFLDGTKRLPKCKTLRIYLLRNHHGLAPAVLHLLRSCNSMRKLRVNYSSDSSRTCQPSCPCCFKESHNIDGIDLGSLKKVEINSYKDLHEGLEFLELLFRCNAKVQKLVINYKASGTPETMVCEKVRSMCRPNLKVKFYVFPDGPHGRRVRFD